MTTQDLILGKKPRVGSPKDMRGLPDKSRAKEGYLQLEAHLFIQTKI